MTTGDFFDGRNAILAGSLGLMATLDEASLPGIPNPGCPENVTCIQAVPPHYGWLVGDGGWVALTGDRGKSWRPPLGDLPPGAALFDFTAIAVRGGDVLDRRQARQPYLLHFRRRPSGRPCPPASTVPLRAITFVDDLHGWAVGQLG